METLLPYLGFALLLLMTVATLVAVVEQLRGRARLAQWRAEAAARRAFEYALAPEAAEPEMPVVAEISAMQALPPPVRAHERSVLAGTPRRSARPAVGQPSSGWSETEPAVLGGPTRAHFDPTEWTIPRVNVSAPSRKAGSVRPADAETASAKDRDSTSRVV